MCMHVCIGMYKRVLKNPILADDRETYKKKFPLLHESLDKCSSLTSLKLEEIKFSICSGKYRFPFYKLLGGCRPADILSRPVNSMAGYSWYRAAFILKVPKHIVNCSQGSHPAHHWTIVTAAVEFSSCLMVHSLFLFPIRPVAIFLLLSMRRFLCAKPGMCLSTSLNHSLKAWTFTYNIHTDFTGCRFQPSGRK